MDKQRNLYEFINLIMDRRRAISDIYLKGFKNRLQTTLKTQVTKQII